MTQSVLKAPPPALKTWAHRRHRVMPLASFLPGYAEPGTAALELYDLFSY
ncbi:hypothetical protein M1N58_03330 [Dehalococcoidales bacterium]|nr:hypothetical protein [Dehalococcoidales bacterium]